MPIATMQPTIRSLEERTLFFARDVRFFIKNLPFSCLITSDSDQLLRASGSVGANYLEAQEAVSKKDFLHRIRISRKEIRECRFWLLLLQPHTPVIQSKEHHALLQEADELTKILSAIAKKIEHQIPIE
jgi:four helix bundle protein